MCLAIVKTAGATIDEGILEAGFMANEDGAGIAFVKNGRLEIEKGFFTFDQFIKRYRKQVRVSKPALIHFRLATAGQVDKVNCHPWRIDRELCVIHNGVLPHHSCPVYSDTGHFTKDVLKPNRDRVWDSGFREEIERKIGVGNKLAFLNSAGNFAIYNEHRGFWEDGVWYSNQNHLRFFDYISEEDENEPDDSFPDWCGSRDQYRLDARDWRY